jgi:hypothetical protein
MDAFRSDSVGKSKECQTYSNLVCTFVNSDLAAAVVPIENADSRENLGPV